MRFCPEGVMEISRGGFPPGIENGESAKNTCCFEGALVIKQLLKSTFGYPKFY